MPKTLMQLVDKYASAKVNLALKRAMPYCEKYKLARARRAEAKAKLELTTCIAELDLPELPEATITPAEPEPVCTCTHCSGPVETNLTGLAPGLCHTCTFWLEKVEAKDRLEVARVNGNHYFIGPNNVGPFYRGSGGIEFKIKFKDGREVVSTNVWCQGTIPDNFKALLPDNAIFSK